MHVVCFKGTMMTRCKRFVQSSIGTAISLFVLFIFSGQTAQSREPLWDTGSGAKIDVITGLMWEVSSPGFFHTWEVARDYCQGLSLSGHTDWRLPTIKELMSIRTFTQIESGSRSQWSSTATSTANTYLILRFPSHLPSPRLASAREDVNCVRDARIAD